ncbi:MAG: ABC transporter permease [Actinomycetota bacterium]|nr:ABC transporter permease [Actinomycetota bacterium]
MSTTAGTLTLAPARPNFRAATLTDAIRSEWTKTRSVPSTAWTLLCAVGLGVGLGALISALTARQYAKGNLGSRVTWDPTSISTAGLSIAQLAIGVLGIMIITSEYSTRAIMADLTAVPRRGRYLAAKAVVILTVTFVVSAVTAFAAFFLGQALISGNAPTASLGQPDVLRALVGCALYGMLIGLFGLALGTIPRSAAAAIAVLVAVLFVLPAIAAALPTNVERPVEEWWPTQAGQQVTSVVRAAHTLAPWTGLGVLALFVALTLAAAAALIRRDA